MKQRISLKLLVTLSFLLLGGTLVIGYSLLSGYYYHEGMQTVFASEMEKTAHHYIERVPPSKRKKVENFEGYMIASRWQDLPDQLRANFKDKPPTPGFSVEVAHPSFFGGPKSISFVYNHQKAGNNIFVGKHGTKATAPQLVGYRVGKSRELLLIISLSCACIIGGVIILLLRRVSRPVASLGSWAKSLTPEKLTQPAPDFSYPELNELAILIKQSLSSVQESLVREQNFLRFASHELRTPIAVMRSNVELLHKIKETMDPEKNQKIDNVVDRIDRASLNMQYFTETLLWLSRKEMESLPAKELQLNRIIVELVEDMKYLLQGKNVSLDIQTHEHSVSLPEFPVKIVLGNVIRNAFQHSWEGTVTITQQENQVITTNPKAPVEKDQSGSGFGLGLQLTNQLTQKLDWKYEKTSTDELYQVSIHLGD